MSKLFHTAADAVKDVVFDGAVIAVGGFGIGGTPFDLIEAVRDTGVRNLTIVSNNLGIDGKGLGILLENNQISNVIASYVGENKLFAQQFLDGKLNVEFCPQGTLAERMRAGGSGIPGFYTATGVGTPVAEGKPTMDFDGRTYILEGGIKADVALVRAHTADLEGNLRYRFSARNFNPLVAMCGAVTLAEAQNILTDAYIDPNEVMTPGIFVQRVVKAHKAPEFENINTRPRG